MTRTETKPRKHALAGNGPVVDRAREALRRVAEQFGRIRRTTQTTVDVAASEGLELTLSYDPGNYIFSRVYNLTVTATLPECTGLPPRAELRHRGRDGARYVRADGQYGSALQRLNRVAGPHLSGIDVHSSRVGTVEGSRTFSVTPLGGSYVWVLIPPVFKATAFPPGEPERILDLIRAVRSIDGATSDTTKGLRP